MTDWRLTEGGLGSAMADFEAACRAFFFCGDRLAGAVLHAIETADACPSDADAAQFEAELSRALGGQALDTLSDADRAAMRATRDRIRGEFHAQNTEDQRSELERLVAASQSRSSLGTTPPGGDSQRLRTFLASHASNVGAHPFIAGLEATLREQMGEASRLRWSLDDAVLTQAGGLEFTEAAVELLLVALGFEARARDDVEQGSGVVSGGSSPPQRRSYVLLRLMHRSSRWSYCPGLRQTYGGRRAATSGLGLARDSPQRVAPVRQGGGRLSAAGCWWCCWCAVEAVNRGPGLTHDTQPSCIVLVDRAVHCPTHARCQIIAREDKVQNVQGRGAPLGTWFAP